MNGLGIDWKILVGQIINFLILLWILNKFVIKPFLALLNKRQNQIAEGIKKSEEADKSLQKAKLLIQEAEMAAEKRAKEIIAAAEKRAKEKSQEILAAAEQEKQKIIKNAQEAAKLEGIRLRQQSQKEIAEIAFIAAQKFLAETINEETDKKIIEQLVAQIIM